MPDSSGPLAPFGLGSRLSVSPPTRGLVDIGWWRPTVDCSPLVLHPSTGPASLPLMRRPPAWLPPLRVIGSVTARPWVPHGLPLPADTNLSTGPKVFIEAANMRNAADASVLVSPAWQVQAAKAITAGLTAYLTSR
jgi:hypothetical protein